MDVQTYTILSEVKADSFFNKKLLDDDGVARIEQSIQSSKTTLNIADRLETARDNLRSSIEFERNVNRQTRAFGVRFSLIDLQI